MKTKKFGNYNSGFAKKELMSEKPIERAPIRERTQDTRGIGEFLLKRMMRYKCDKKGHVSKICPRVTENSPKGHHVATEEGTEEEESTECEGEQANYEE